MSKVRSTLRSCVRDWSAEGKDERAACYGFILKVRFFCSIHLPFICPSGHSLSVCLWLSFLFFLLAPRIPSLSSAVAWHDGTGSFGIGMLFA